MNTDTKHTKFLTVYKSVIIALSVLSAGLCAVCTALFYDYSPGYFKENTLCSIFSISVAITVLFALSSFIGFKKSFKLKSPDNPSAPSFLFLIPACGFLFYAISIASRIFEANNNTYIFIAHALFSAASFAYFLLCNLNTKIDAGLKSVLGLISVISPMLIAIRSYFDYFAVMNSPEKTYLQISMVAFALYIINEARFILGEPYPRFYLALAGIIFPISSCYTINKIFIIANTKGKANAEDISLCVLMASIAIYSLFRIIYSSKKECEECGENVITDDSQGTSYTTNNDESEGENSSENPDLNTNA